MGNDLYCPHTKNCLVYETWNEKAGDGRLNVIQEHGRECKYICLAHLITNGDPESSMGVPELDAKMGSNGIPGDFPECAFVQILNNQVKILRLLENLGENSKRSTITVGEDEKDVLLDRVKV